MFNDKYGLTQAVLEGRKTQTRRLLTLTLHEGDIRGDLKEVYPDKVFRCVNRWMFEYKRKVYDIPTQNYPKYSVGEIVSIAQSYSDIDPIIRDGKNKAHLEYMDSLLPEMKELAAWRNKMFVKAKHMPHQIRITNVRIERLQDISDEDCLKEGIVKCDVCGDCYFICRDDFDDCSLSYNTARKAYAALIDKVSGKGTWEKNPYVFVYDFKLIK